MTEVLDPGGLVVVAGAGGFIGGHLVAGLQAAGARRIRAVDSKPIGQWHQRPPEVEYVQADLRPADACYRVTEGASYVFNLAADMGGMGFIETHKADCMLSVLISTHLLLAARDQGVKRFFYSSSACVYNASKQTDAAVKPLREEDAYPAMPEDGYGWEKLFTERMCQHFTDEFGLQTRVARYHNVYGPLGTWDGGREKAPAAICRKVAQAKLGGLKEIEIWGDGEQTRSFMFVDDCVEGTLRIMSSDFADPINLGSDRLVSINQLVDIVEEIAGTKLKRVHNLAAPKGVRGRNSDNTLIAKRLDWEPQVTLEEGLQKTYSWIYDQLASGSHDLSAYR
ncbi:MAG TPA: NAD-dependent epimerase/dehydratase family protein [Candidatus Solibacter sp.]|jgi:GDP-D-mannose 3',5'-epimerase|nr:NAD-dependent epimerase/dehydratase family protein [Candidatus Solibacter sp.]